MKTTTQTQKTVVTCFAVFLLAMVPATVLAGSRGIVASGPVRPNPEERGIVTSGPVRPNPLAIVTSGPVRPLDFEGVIPYEPLSPAENGNDLLSVAPWAARPKFIEGVDRPQPLVHLLTGGENAYKQIMSQ